MGKRFTCMNCKETKRSTKLGAQLRFRYLCSDCIQKGKRLRLTTMEAFAYKGRKWTVEVASGRRDWNRIHGHMVG